MPRRGRFCGVNTVSSIRVGGSVRLPGLLRRDEVAHLDDLVGPPLVRLLVLARLAELRQGDARPVRGGSTETSAMFTER